MLPAKRERLNGNDRSQVHSLLLCLVSSLSVPALSVADFNFSDPEGGEEKREQQLVGRQRTSSYWEEVAVGVSHE